MQDWAPQGVSHHPNVCKMCYYYKKAMGYLLLPTFRELWYFYFSFPLFSFLCPHLPFYVSFYLSALSVSSFSSICTIIMAPQWEFDWCLSDTNKQGWSWGMLLSREKITQIRGETSTAFIQTLSTPGTETTTKVNAKQENAMRQHLGVEVLSAAGHLCRRNRMKFYALFEASLICLRLQSCKKKLQ